MTASGGVAISQRGERIVDINWLNAVIGIVAGLVSIVAGILTVMQILKRRQREPQQLADQKREPERIAADQIRAIREAMGMPDPPPAAGESEVQGGHVIVADGKVVWERYRTRRKGDDNV